MKILHLLDTIDRGGAEAQALDVCRNASRFGMDMTLVTGGGGLADEFRASGVEYLEFKRRFRIDFGFASKLRAAIVERDIEIVHGYQAVDGLHIYLATRGLQHVKRVLSFQGFIADRKNRLASKFLIPRMDANIVVSRGMQKWLEEVDGLDTSHNFHLIYNGADPNRIKPSGKSLRTELRLPDETSLIGMVANFYRDPRKDQLTVCRALPEVFKKFPDVHCIFAGKTEPGAEEKVAACERVCEENGIADRVHFLGGRGDVPDILAALDVFVFSSLHEGLPVAVSEAMLAGVPMIVSDIEPLLEATGDGEYAEVFRVGDARALRDHLIGLLGDGAKRRALGERATRFAIENFSIDAHMKRLSELYESLL